MMRIAIYVQTFATRNYDTTLNRFQLTSLHLRWFNLTNFACICFFVCSGSGNGETSCTHATSTQIHSLHLQKRTLRTQLKKLRKSHSKPARQPAQIRRHHTGHYQPTRARISGNGHDEFRRLPSATTSESVL